MLSTIRIGCIEVAAWHTCVLIDNMGCGGFETAGCGFRYGHPPERVKAVRGLIVSNWRVIGVFTGFTIS